MDKHILHSVLETLTVGQIVNLGFNEPFSSLTGDYKVLVSKVGRGRNGSRVIEIAPISNPMNILSAIEVNGRTKLLGSATSELINSITVNGKVHDAEPAEESVQPRRRGRPAGKTAKNLEEKQCAKTSKQVQCERVAKVLSDILTENPQTNFKFVAMDPVSPINGEWKVENWTFNEGVLKMNLTNMDNPEIKQEFDSEIHGIEVKDAQIIGVEEEV